MENEQVIMRKNGEIIAQGHPADVREVIEDMVFDKLGFCPSLQESTDDEYYDVYLHTDAYEELNEEQLERLNELSITEFRNSIEGFKKLLQVEFELLEGAVQ